MAARHAVLADLAQSARPGTPAETASAFSHGELLPAVGSSGSCRRDEQPVLDPLMQARALVCPSIPRGICCPSSKHRHILHISHQE